MCLKISLPVKHHDVYYGKHRGNYRDVYYGKYFKKKSLKFEGDFLRYSISVPFGACLRVHYSLRDNPQQHS